jgi:DNA-binding PadR family transcriptional regulator
MASRVETMVLGLLAEGERHGYDLIREMDDRGMLRWSRASKVAVYKALARLEEEGCLTSWTEKDGNLPEKRVYAITAAGDEKLREMVYALCSERESLRIDSAIGVAFIRHLSADEAGDALRQRRAFLQAMLRRLAKERDFLEGMAHDINMDILARERSAYREEIRWLAGIIDRIEDEKVSGRAGSVSPPQQ